jgi:hypothetical protein
MARVTSDNSEETKMYTEGRKSKKKESCFVPVEERGEEGGLSREVWEERELELEASGKAFEKRRGQEGRPKRLERKKRRKRMRK